MEFGITQIAMYFAGSVFCLLIVAAILYAAKRSYLKTECE